MFKEESPGLLMCLWVGTGRYAYDKVQGFGRNALITGNMLGLVSDETLSAFERKIIADYDWYQNTEVGKSFMGAIGESGFVFYMIATPYFPATTTKLGASVLNMTIGALDAAFSASIKPTPTNLVIYSGFGYLFGAAHCFLAKFGVTAYNSAVFIVEVAAGEKLDRKMQREQELRAQYDASIEQKANELWEQSIGGTGWWNDVDGRFDDGAKTSWGTPITWTRDQIRDDLRNGNPFNINNYGASNNFHNNDNRAGGGGSYTPSCGSSSYDYSANFSPMPDSAPSFSWASRNKG